MKSFVAQNDLIQTDHQKQMLKNYQNYMDKEINMKQNLVGNGFLHIPKNDNDKYLNRVNINGEIISAENFDCEEIYIKYELVIPPWWKYEYDVIPEYSEEEILDELNRESSITQSVSSLTVNENGKEKIKYNFCFPLDWQLAVDEEFVLSRWPIICFQVNSYDSWGRAKSEGYGFCEIPKFAGFHELSVKTWKPTENINDMISSFYLGGSIKLKDFKKIAMSFYITDQNTETFINRMSMNSTSNGSINLRFNITVQSNEFRTISIEKYLKHTDDIKIEEKTKEYEDAGYTVGYSIPKLLQNDMGHKIGRYSKFQINN